MISIIGQLKFLKKKACFCITHFKWKTGDKPDTNKYTLWQVVEEFRTGEKNRLKFLVMRYSTYNRIAVAKAIDTL